MRLLSTFLTARIRASSTAFYSALPFALALVLGIGFGGRMALAEPNDSHACSKYLENSYEAQLAEIGGLLAEAGNRRAQNPATAAAVDESVQLLVNELQQRFPAKNVQRDLKNLVDGILAEATVNNEKVAANTQEQIAQETQVFSHKVLSLDSDIISNSFVSPDGKHFVVARQVGSPFKKTFDLDFYDGDTLQKVATVGMKGNWTIHVEWSLDSGTAAVYSSDGAHAGKIKLINLRDGFKEYNLRLCISMQTEFVGGQVRTCETNIPIERVEFTSDGKILTRTRVGAAEFHYIFDISDEWQGAGFGEDQVKNVTGKISFFVPVGNSSSRLTSSGKSIVVQDKNELSVVEISGAGRKVINIDPNPFVKLEHLSPKSDFAVVSGLKKAAIVNLENGQNEIELLEKTLDLNFIQWRSDGEELFTINTLNWLRSYNLKTKQTTSTALPLVGKIDRYSDRVVVSNDRRNVLVFSKQTGLTAGGGYKYKVTRFSLVDDTYRPDPLGPGLDEYETFGALLGSDQNHILFYQPSKTGPGKVEIWKFGGT